MKKIVFLVSSISYFLIIFSLSIPVAFAQLPTFPSGTVELRNGNIPLEVVTSNRLHQALQKVHEQQLLTHRINKVHVAIQLSSIPSEYNKTRLSNMGIHLLSHLQGNNWLASIEGEKIKNLRMVDEPVAIGILTANNKQSVRVREGRFGNHSRGKNNTVFLAVQFYKDVPIEKGKTIVSSVGGIVESVVSAINVLIINIPVHKINVLAGENAVMWVEEVLPPMDVSNNITTQIIQASSVYNTPYNLSGAGVKAMVYDGDVVYDHTDLPSPRVSQGEIPADIQVSLRNHATHVTGTIAGDGTLSAGLYAGVAPQTEIASYGFCCINNAGWLYSNPQDLEENYRDALTRFDIDIANNSLSTNVASNGYDCEWEGNYNTTSQLIDSIVTGVLGKPITIIWVVGNDRSVIRCGVEWGTVPPPANAKNVISVGATDVNDLMTSFSSWGPTDDGRIKPDVVAPGVAIRSTVGSTTLGNEGYTYFSGTSHAAPAVTGVVSLLIEHYRNRNPNLPDPLPSSIKALLIHSAVDLGPVGPDYAFGYGRVDAHAAADLISNDALIEDTIFRSGQVKEYKVNVANGDPELRISLAWDDLPGNPLAAMELVNDLDLEILDPTGITYFPWMLDPANPSAPAARGEDHRNVMEQVVVLNPMSGTWLVRVKGTNIPQSEQKYSLVSSAIIDRSFFPLVSGFNPALDTNGAEATFVFVFGENFDVRTGKTTVLVNGITQPFAQVIDNGLLVFLLSSGDAIGRIQVYTPSGVSVSSTDFGIPATELSINGFWPLRGSPQDLVFVFGSKFATQLGGTQVSLNGKNILFKQVLDENLLIFMIPPDATSGTILVTTPDGSAPTVDDLIVIQP